jgi:VanZ family protein
MTASPSRFAVHLSVFLVLLGLWTWKLLEPHPVPEGLRERLAEYNYAAAKTLHAGGYALLTILAATLPVSRGWRLALVVFLFLHGMGTEIGQTYVPNRTGRVLDVIIDWGGITLGLVILEWFAWRASKGGQ